MLHVCQCCSYSTNEENQMSRHMIDMHGVKWRLSTKVDIPEGKRVEYDEMIDRLFNKKP